MPGNFYSETLADELRRVKAELSRERSLCAGLAEALKRIQDAAAPGQEMSLRDAIDALCDCWNMARSALSELEKQA